MRPRLRNGEQVEGAFEMEIPDNLDGLVEAFGEEFVRDYATRQIEAKALRKLKHPSRSRKLRGFLNT